MAIRAGGIGSGLDIESLVAQLVSAEAQPTNARLNTQELELEAELSAYGTLKSALSTFQASVDKMEGTDAFQVYDATSSDDTLFTATASSSAAAGNYDIEVLQLAQVAKLRSADFTDSSEVVGTGTLDITLGADTFQITIDGTNNTLSNIRDAINAASDNPGVTASLITVDSGTQLILTSDKTGTSNTITVAAVDDDGADGFDLTRLDSASLVSMQPPLNAIIEVDAQTVTRDSNSFSDVISGVTFNLAKADIGTVETLTITTDISAIKKNIEEFVSNYNVLTGVMKGLSNYDIDTGIAGALNGDSIVRGIQNQLRQSLFSGATGGVFSTLNQLGITLDDTGSLTIDSSELDDKLTNNLSDVEQLFSSSTGLAQLFTSALAGYQGDDGILESRTDGIDSRLDGIDDSRDTLTRRMDALETRLRAQFIAMDLIVAQLSSIGTFLTGALASLPEPNSINRN